MSIRLSSPNDREKFIKRCVYIAIFAAVLRIDMITGSDGGWLRMTYANLWGVFVAILLLMQSPFSEYKKLPYYIWLGISIVGLPIAIYVILHTVYYKGQWITGALNVAALGFVAIKLIMDYLVQKKPLRIQKPVFAVWLLMMALMIVSKNDSFWPFWFLVMFGAVYLTEFKQEEISLLFDGASEGIILGFIWVQGFAFLYRPFDVIRYLGAYANSNVNALMYAVVECAFLYKWYVLIQKKEIKRAWRLIPALFAGAMCAFVLMTQCRSASLALVAEMVGFLIVVTAMQKEHRIRAFFTRALLILTLFVISILPVYAAIRYLPALRHHPIWYDYEYSEEKVHSYDPMDSEKYISLKEIGETAFSRYIHGSEGTWAERDAALERKQYEERAAASANDPNIGYDPETEPFESSTYYYSSISRMQVYKHFLHNMNFGGHKNSESVVTVSSGFDAPHAHDVFLQWMFLFGIVPGVLFIGLFLYNLYKTFWYLGRKNYTYAIVLGLLTVMFGVFGALEITWRIGQAALFLYFLAFKVSFAKPEKADSTVFDNTGDL